MFTDRQKDTKETLEDLKDVINEINSAQKEQAEKKMPSDIFSVYWILRKQGITQAEGIARDSQEIFSNYPYWRSSEEQERKVRQDLYKILIKNKLQPKKISEVGSKLIDVLKRGAE